jgi:CelD/BcsL family acetyltransferase involved in cellulose biosynthesis
LSEARVNEIEPGSDSRWDEFVAEHPDGHVYQHSAWLRCLAAEYGNPLIGLCTEDEGGRLTGVLPLVATRGMPLLRRNATLGARLASLPRTPLAGPLTVDRDATVALLEAAVARAGQAGARLQLKRASADLEGLVAGIGGAPWRDSYVLTLPDDPAALRFGNSRNHGRIKWAVNKASKEGVQVRVAGDIADVRAWYPLYVRTMREVVVPPRPLRLFEAMWRELGERDMMRLYLAEQPGAGLLAGSIVIGFGRTAFYAFNGRLRSALPLRPNEVIQWEAIHDAVRRGFERYDLGEVTADRAGLAEFKRKWGADEVRLHRYYHPPPEHATNGDVARSLQADEGAAKRAAVSVWQRLPLAATRFAGDLAYRWL